MHTRFDQAALGWDQDQQRVRMAEAIADVMIGHLKLKPDHIVMDYGAGTGLIALKLRPHVGTVVAVDTSRGMLNALQEKLTQGKITNVDLIHGTIGDETVPFPAVDVIVSSMAFHHIQDTAGAAKAFWALLKSGGKIAIADLDEENGEFHADPNSALHNGFVRGEFQKIFEQAGFTGLHFYDAYTAKKQTAGNSEKSFPIFLMTAVKR